MKKSIIISLTALLLFTVMGCSSNHEENIGAENETQKQEENEDKADANRIDEPQDKVETNEGLSVDKNLLSVEITLPADFAGDLSGFDRKVYLEENPDIIDAKVMDNGGLWLKMSRSKHSELMREMEDNLRSMLNDLIEGKETPYITDIKASGDYREIEVMVDREGYESTFDMSSLSILFSVGYLHVFEGEEFELHLQYIDADTDEVIDEMSFPEY